MQAALNAPSLQTDFSWLGPIVRDARLAKGLSVSEVSRRCNLRWDTVFRTENSQTVPTLPVLSRIAVVLDLTLPSLLTQKEARHE